MVVHTTSMWKGYGLNSEPGLQAYNSHLASPHELQRLEGIAAYYGPPYDTMPIRGKYFANAGGYSNVVMKDRYDAATQSAMQRDGYVEARDQWRRDQLGRFQLRPVPRYDDPGSYSTQASASRHRLEQRYMGSGFYDHSRDIRSDMGTTFTSNMDDYQHGVADLRQQDAWMVTDLRKQQRLDEMARLDAEMRVVYPGNSAMSVEASAASAAHLPQVPPGYTWVAVPNSAAAAASTTASRRPSLFPSANDSPTSAAEERSATTRDEAQNKTGVFDEAARFVRKNPGLSIIAAVIATLVIVLVVELLAR